MVFSIIFLGTAFFLFFPLLSSSAPLKVRRSHTPGLPVKRSPTSYSLMDTFQGDTFFDGFSFFTAPDPTNGFVNYVSQETAQTNGLVNVTGGVARISVDSTSTLPMGTNRNSVRISSTKTYSGGLFVYDVAHMPTGCSVWPALWSTETEGWPNNGEIDVIEGVHESTSNQITMHTNAGCSLATGQTITGTVAGTTCESTPTSNAGCATMDPNGWGTAFNTAGGGVFAVVWEPESGIKVFHFPRNSIPTDITSKSPNPTSWGDPVSFMPNGDSCNIAEHFQNHQIIINITLCGAWAGATYSCGGTCQSAVMNPANYVDAYWEINSIMVYQ